MTLGKSRGLAEPQFLHPYNGDPLALPLPPHPGSHDINSACLVKCEAGKVIILSRSPRSNSVVLGVGGKQRLRERQGLGSWGGEGESLSGSERGRFQALGRCEGRRGDRQKLSQSQESQRQRGRERPR